jgi:hypothetical protein
MTKVIGSQSDVPDVGDPIVSPWHQDTARKIVHPFPSVAARDAWASPPEGARCYVEATKRDYRRVGGVWESIPIVVAGAGSVTGDGAGNGIVVFPRAFPAAPNVVVINCLDYANVGCIPFNTLATQTSVGLRRPADNSPIGGIAVAVGYVAVLM